MIYLNEPDWHSENAAELRAFLKTPTGQKMLGKLYFFRPAFMPSTAHPHKSFANSRDINGYEQAIKTLLSLIESDQPLSAVAESQTLNSYPDLDDDSQWPQDPA